MNERAKPATQTERPAPAQFMGRHHMLPGAEKAKDFKGTIFALAGYMRRYWASMVVVLIFSLASTAFVIVSPRILGNMTNQVVDDYTKMKVYDRFIAKLPPGTRLPAGTTGADMIRSAPTALIAKIPADKLEEIKALDLSKRPGIDFNKLRRTALILIALYLLSTFFAYAQAWIMSTISQQTSYNLRRDIAAKIKRLPLKYFDSRTHGDVLSRVANDVDLVSQTLNQSLAQA